MTPEELFSAALGLGKQWQVVECRFEGEPKRLELRIEHVRAEHFDCALCGQKCGIHDTIERRWRHLNFFQYRCELVAKVPRTWCRKDGVHQVQVPWARQGSGFTLMMEALMMLLSAEMPVDAMADLLDEHDTRLWRVLMHYVEKAHTKSDWSAVRRIAVDETSARRGHRYVTTVLDAENSRLLLMVEGRSAEALGTFADALREHGGDPSQIQAIAMDMSPAYVKGATQYFPQARIVFDKFHLMVLSGQALDEKVANYRFEACYGQKAEAVKIMVRRVGLVGWSAFLTGGVPRAPGQLAVDPSGHLSLTIDFSWLKQHSPCHKSKFPPGHNSIMSPYQECVRSA